MSNTTERKPLTLKRPVANTLEGSSLVRAARGQQRHVLPAKATTTLCGIDSGKWIELVNVSDEKVNCPPCAAALKALAKKA
jgi:hypothetical protein